MQADRATAFLAVVRIVCVLGMSFGIALGIFLLLGGWWITGLIALIAAAPFFALMRYMEKKHWEAEKSAFSGQASAIGSQQAAGSEDRLDAES